MSPHVSIQHVSIQGGSRLSLRGEAKPFAVELTCERQGDGLDLVRLRLTAPQPAVPPRLVLSLDVPHIDIHGRWHPGTLHARHVPPDWAPSLRSDITRSAPVVCLFSLSGANRLTLACSETLQPVRMWAGIHEETAEVRCRVELFGGHEQPTCTREATLRIDARGVPWQQSLAEVATWWEPMPGHQPRAVAAAARRPMYRTWYRVLEEVEPAAVLAQGRVARELGFAGVIVDDGWQTRDSSRGYAYAGDWEPQRVGDMADLVRQVHDLGMTFLLWYAVPFVGTLSKAMERHGGRLMSRLEALGAGVVDPRYPEVRADIIGTYERALREWGLDGFKLDFVDEFSLRGATPPPVGPGADYPSLPEATDRLLGDLFDRLHAIRPDIMVEFRQEYIGPSMRRFGNMFRAGDCPGDALSNRVRTLDIRVLCGTTAAHSDMSMWHPQDTPESAALQVLAGLFAVPQISVLLDRLPAAHLEMLRFWLGFWQAHSDLLLDGALSPLHPESLYPVVRVDLPGRRLIAVYDGGTVEPGPDTPDELLVVNATLRDHLVLDLSQDLGHRRVTATDCRGRVVRDVAHWLPAGPHRLVVPPAGLLRLTPA